MTEPNVNEQIVRDLMEAGNRLYELVDAQAEYREIREAWREWEQARDNARRAIGEQP